jgi:rod shape-determining protein MreD
MKVGVMIVLLLAAAVSQGLTPAIAWLGTAKPPFLLGVAVFYALRASRGMAVTAAILAGIIQDSLSLFPLGYSALCFTGFGLLLVAGREFLFRENPLTVAVLGAVLGAATTGALSLMCLLGEQAGGLPPGWLALKMAGGALLGAGAVPAVCGLGAALESHTGIVREEAR